MAQQKHGFFRAFVILNLVADIFMAIYSGVISGNPAMLVGMSVLAICFIFALIGMSLINLRMRSSSCAIAAFGYFLINAMTGFIFACRMFSLLEGEVFSITETILSVAIFLTIIIDVNVLTRRKVEGDL